MIDLEFIRIEKRWSDQSIFYHKIESFQFFKDHQNVLLGRLFS